MARTARVWCQEISSSDERSSLGHFHIRLHWACELGHRFTITGLSRISFQPTASVLQVFLRSRYFRIPILARGSFFDLPIWNSYCDPRTFQHRCILEHKICPVIFHALKSSRYFCSWKGKVKIGGARCQQLLRSCVSTRVLALVRLQRGLPIAKSFLHS